jgi:hypothetical protein
MYFKPSEEEKVLLLEKGGLVTVEGEIKEIGRRRVDLIDCRLVDR